MVQAKAPAHLLEGSWPTEALLAQIAVSKHSEHMPLNRQAVVMARPGVPIDRSVPADLDGTDRGTDRTGGGSYGSGPEAGQHPALRPLSGHCCAMPCRAMDETTAPVLDPGRGKTKTGYLWAVLRDGEPLRRHWFEPNGERLERHRAAGRRLPLSAWA